MNKKFELHFDFQDSQVFVSYYNTHKLKNDVHIQR